LFLSIDNKFQALSSTQLAEREQQLEEELYNMKKQWDTTTRDLERAKGENVNLTVALEKLREEKEAAEDNELKSLEAYPLMMSIFIHNDFIRFTEEEHKVEALMEKTRKMEKLLSDLGVAPDEIDALAE
jgi:hypothetical protein